MVRIIKIGRLEQRRRVLVEESQRQREILRREVAELKSSILAMPSGLGMVPVIGKALRIGVPMVARFLVKPRKPSKGKRGFLSHFFDGLGTAAKVMGMVEKARNAKASEEEAR
jgi:hypothetical protein